MNYGLSREAALEAANRAYASDRNSNGHGCDTDCRSPDADHRTRATRALLRAAPATADDTTILMVGGPAGVPFAVSRWEAALL